MTNEFVGIIGAIGLTFLLFVLRHFILPSERGNKRGHVSQKASRDNHGLSNKPVDDGVGLTRNRLRGGDSRRSWSKP